MLKTNLFEIVEKTKPIYQKYKYALLIFLIGIIMLFIGSPRDAPKAQDTKINIDTSFNIKEFQENLEKQLSSIKGAGKVSLLLTIEDTEEAVYASNIRESSSGESNNIYEKDISILSDNSYGEKPIRIKSISPTFRGAVILCEGAKDYNVKLNITEAVSAACGLSMDKISVLEMDKEEENYE